MIGFEIKDDLKRLEKNLSRLERKVLPTAIPKAINKTGPSVQSVIIKEVAAETKIKRKDIRKVVVPKAFKASVQRPYFKINFEDARATNLIEFVPPSKRNAKTFRRRTRKGFVYKGVQANAWGVKKTYQGAFIGRGKGSGKQLVFKRSGRKIETVRGPSARQTFRKEHNVTLMKRKAAERFPIETQRAIKFQLRKYLK